MLRPAPADAAGAAAPAPGRRREAAGPGGAGWIEGSTVAERPRRSFPEVAATLLPVAEALAELHGFGWVHGDVSAANVVVGPDGAGVLIDFDRAAPIGAARATGTPGFVAPEVEAGAPVTPAADVWSLAAVARATTTGPCPEVDAVLAAGPADRPTELVTLFAGAADPRAATTRDYGPKPPAHLARPPAPRRSPLAAAAVLAAAVLAGVLAALARAGPTSAPPDVGVVVEPSGGSDRVPVVPPG